MVKNIFVCSSTHSFLNYAYFDPCSTDSRPETDYWHSSVELEPVTTNFKSPIALSHSPAIHFSPNFLPLLLYWQKRK